MARSEVSDVDVFWRAPGLRRERLYGYYFIAPAVLLLVAIIVFPLGHAFSTSLYRIRGLRSSFVGFDNYAKVLADDAFWHSLGVSLTFTSICVVLHLVIGLGLALLLNRVRAFKTVLRIAFLTPWMVAPAISAIIWVWLLEPQFGVINYLLREAGLITTYQAWLGIPNLALGSVIAVDVWRGVPFIMLLMLAGLQGIPKEQYEAASLDGAGSLQQFRHVTLPNLRYLIIVASTLDLIYTIRHFDIIAVMTGGGPVDSTEVLPVLLYNTAFHGNRFGEAATIGVLLLILVLAFSAIYIRLLKPGSATEGA